ncbi:MAG: DUF1697 domain-containing protein [Gemmatimonadaceae bacterium]
MPRYVALLRAINVGGHVVKMDALRAHFDAMGFTDVATFIASGNVLFTAGGAGAASPATLERRIAQTLEDALGYAIETFLRTPAQMAAAAVHEPFGALAADDTRYVGFLAAPLDAAGRRALAGFNSDVDDFAAHAGEVHWRCRVRSSDSTFNIKKFEKAIGQKSTFRNVTTVRKLAALLQAAG